MLFLEIKTTFGNENMKKYTYLTVAVLFFAAFVFVAASAPPQRHSHRHNNHHDHHHKDEYVEYAHQSYLEKIGGSVAGASIGFLLFLLPFPCLFWNEGRSVRRSQALNEGMKQEIFKILQDLNFNFFFEIGARKVVSTDSKQVSPVLDGRLVHLQGIAEAKESLSKSHGY